MPLEAKENNEGDTFVREKHYIRKRISFSDADADLSDIMQKKRSGG